MPERKISRLESGILDLKRKRDGYPPIIVAHGCVVIGLFFMGLGKIFQRTAFGDISTLIGLLFGAPAVWLYSVYRSLDQELRDTVVPDAIGLVRPGLKYFAHSTFTAVQLAQTHFFPWEIAQARTFNEIRGTHKGIPYRTFQFSASARSRKQHHNQSLSGLMIEIDHGRNVKGITKVEPDLVQEIAGSTIGKFFEEPFQKIAGLELVRLESPEFEELFVATSTDPIEARRWLTPKMMEQLVAAHKQLDKRLSCVFMEKRLLICIQGYEINLNVTPETSLASVRQELEIAISRVETLIDTLEIGGNIERPQQKRKLVRLG